MQKEKNYSINQIKIHITLKNFQIIGTFGEDIYNGEITLEEADNNQSNLLNEIKNFKYKTEPKSDKKRQEKENVEKNLYNFYEGREMVLNAFKSKIFLTKSKGSGISNINHSNLKISTPKQMLKRLPTALAQVKAGNNSESLLNEISQILRISQKKLPKKYTIT